MSSFYIFFFFSFLFLYLCRYYSRGSIVIAVIYVLGIATAHLLLYIIEWIRPKHVSCEVKVDLCDSVLYLAY